ncbi:MAG: sensor histidine kinase [Candidatus Thiodiazotropha sp.]
MSLSDSKRVNSLEFRLQAGLTISLILLIILLWLFGAGSVERLTEDFIASRLEHDAEAILGATDLGQGVSVASAKINQIYHRPYSGHYYLMLGADGEEVASRSLWDFKLQVPRMPAGEAQRYHLPGPDGQNLLVWTRGYRKQGADLTLAVAEDLQPLKEQRDRFLKHFALLALAGLMLLLILQGMVVRGAFRRLRPLRQDVQNLTSGQEQLLRVDVPTEFMPLVNEVNHLLRLLSSRNQRSRNALGNLAHALKGPLNLLTRHIDQAASQDPGLRQAHEQVERIRVLMDRELRRARLAGGKTLSERFDARQDLPDLLHALRQIYRDRQLKIDCSIEGEPNPFGDREDILELLGNLLDNACKWAHSQVHCHVSGTRGLRIMVEDDGEGLADDAIELLTQRGRRLDESVDGHGLGLAIVNDVVQLYEGTINFERSTKLHGLLVRIELNPLSYDEGRGS